MQERRQQRAGNSLETFGGSLKEHIVYLVFPVILYFSQSLQLSVSRSVILFNSPPTLPVVYLNIVGSAVMLCLLGNASQLRPLSSVPCLISMHLSFVPCLIYSVSHLFRVSCCSIPYLFHVSAQIASQPSGGSGRVSTFGSCLKSCLDFKPLLAISYA